MKTQKETYAQGLASLDLNSTSGRAYENYDIKEGEIVVTKATSRKQKHAVVISSLNGGDDEAVVGGQQHRRQGHPTLAG